MLNRYGILTTPSDKEKVDNNSNNDDINNSFKKLKAQYEKDKAKSFLGVFL